MGNAAVPLHPEQPSAPTRLLTRLLMVTAPNVRPNVEELFGVMREIEALEPDELLEQSWDDDVWLSLLEQLEAIVEDLDSTWAKRVGERIAAKTPDLAAEYSRLDEVVRARLAELIECAEDRRDGMAADRALSEAGPNVPWEEVKAKHGL